MTKARQKFRKPPRRRPKPRDLLANIPNKGSIIATDTLTAPDGTHYTILETNQTDPYDPRESRSSRLRR